MIIFEDKMSKSSFGFKYKHISYEHMSHAAITKVSWGIKMVFKSERKHTKECAADRAQMKREFKG
jgi:hypothetical protein